ncbi:MAG: hypothetical protein JEY79_19530 [Pseudodesulfovibrio sp.]|nr:hypothetical protein [Pseudodesulfovibrio sp.]
MKKLTITLIVALALSGLCFAADADIKSLGSGSHAILASGSYEAYTQNMSKASGAMSMQISVVGDGTLDVKYQVSNTGTDESDFVYPDNDSEYLIFDDFTDTSGAGSDGESLKEFTPPFANYIRFVFAEVGTSDPITPTVAIMYRPEVY